MVSSLSFLFQRSVGNNFKEIEVVATVLAEKEFLMALALSTFNSQFNRAMKVDDCDIKTITPAYGFKYGYEINTVRLDDFLRMRIYLNVGDTDALGNYTLNMDEGITDGKGTLIDEVWVANGTVDRFWIDSYQYRFVTTLYIDDARIAILLTEDNQALLTESGEYILLENGV